MATLRQQYRINFFLNSLNSIEQTVTKSVHIVNSCEQKVADVAQLQNEQNSGMPLIDIVDKREEDIHNNVKSVDSNSIVHK